MVDCYDYEKVITYLAIGKIDVNWRIIMFINRLINSLRLFQVMILLIIIIPAMSEGKVLEAIGILIIVLLWRIILAKTKFIELFVKNIFDHFDRNSLETEENEVLDDGIIKHISVLVYVFFFAPFMIVLAFIMPDIMALLTAASFIALLLGGAWYTISFQNVSEAQLIAGVAENIKKRMFRGFLLAFSLLPIGMIVFIVKTVLPEVNEFIPSVGDIPLFIRILLLMFNTIWILLVFNDVYKASVAYDGSDSLLGDGFPRLMRGASTTANFLPTLDRIEELLKKIEKK